MHKTIEKINIVNNKLMVGDDQLLQKPNQVFLLDGSPPLISMNSVNSEEAKLIIDSAISEHGQGKVYVSLSGGYEQLSAQYQNAFSDYLIYIMYVNQTKGFSPKASESKYIDGLEFKEYQILSDGLRLEAKSLFVKKIIDPVMTYYKGKENEKLVRDMHDQAMDGIIDNQPFIVAFYNGKVAGLFSWVEKEVIPTINGIITTRLVDSQLPSAIRSAIHSHTFSWMKIQSLPFFASVHCQNKNSHALIQKNNYRPLFANIIKV